jgi:hypothetical protein
MKPLLAAEGRYFEMNSSVRPPFQQNPKLRLFGIKAAV